MKMVNKIIKIILKIVNVLVTLAIIAVIVFMGISAYYEKTGKGKFYGISTYIVMSGSMIPYFYEGSFIVSREVPLNEVQVGDVVTFTLVNDLSGDTLVTHRVTEITNTKDNQEAFVTMGDNNPTPDPNPVTKENFVGKMILFPIPYLGFLLADMKNGYFIMAAVFLIALLLLMPYLVKEENV